MKESFWWHQSDPAFEALFSQLYADHRLPPWRTRVSRLAARSRPTLLP